MNKVMDCSYILEEEGLKRDKAGPWDKKDKENLSSMNKIPEEV